jgi:hypothetical protein
MKSLTSYNIEFQKYDNEGYDYYAREKSGVNFSTNPTIVLY